MSIHNNEKRVTIKDVAKEAGVSPATVSRVLRGYSNVPASTAKIVHAAVNKLDYVANISASSLSGGALKNIGIVVTRSADVAFHNPFFSVMIMGIGTILEKNGYNMQLIMTDNLDEEREKVKTALVSGLIQGVILLYSRKYDMLIQDLANSNFPFVVSGRIDEVTSSKPIYSVDTDNKSGSCDIVNHLIGLGHKRIAILNGSPDYVVNLDRYDGYRRALAMNNIPFDTSLQIDHCLTYDDSKSSVKATLSKHPDITAIFCRDDLKAAAAIQGIKELGLRVPEDIAIVGYNNYDVSIISSPTISTISVPIYDLGNAASRMLLDLIEKKPIDVPHKVLPHRLIIRESCGYTLKKL